ncbi:ribonuclease P protein subunit p25b [Electrophorus electricus]|uniref:ribonuclease P protein subunit p25b n=1 Tax=Electrophorus electricus TaxID=8005 RepID=UPI000F0A643B|nr:ribonuclease P protein subunit p25b [Electrophorus electricus]
MDLSIVQEESQPPQGGTATTHHITAALLTPSPLPPPGPALKGGMTAGFKKVCRTEEDSPCPFPGLLPGVLEMRVKEGSKIRNLMGFAMARMQCEAGSSGQASLRQVVFTGSGRAVTKTITCAEIMKRKMGGLHQLTKVRYKSVREVWESQEGGDGEMTVHRTVPSISILLSKDPLDPLEPGYQPPETQTALWEEREGNDGLHQAGKRPFDHIAIQSETQPKRFCP